MVAASGSGGGERLLTQKVMLRCKIFHNKFRKAAMRLMHRLTGRDACRLIML
ncbi:MAG: hypothetical protein JWR21_4442 [Herminiimonas sp.]|nr:hypothetical protein [Herminiimonas sp.]